jgi:iron complex outermembrane receptor protein
MLYATIQTGYNPGTFNPVPSTPTFDNLVENQTLLSYTAGVKSRFLDNRLQVNAEIFDYEYEDLILQAFSAATGSTAYFNAPKTRIYGADLSVRALVTDNDELSVGLGLLDATLTEFTNQGIDYSGERLMYSPQVSLSLGYQHTTDLSSGAQVVASIWSHYDDGYWTGDSFDHDNHPELWQDSYIQTDVSLAYNAASGKWSVALWCKNLEDEAVVGAGAPISPGFGAVIFEAPRTYGVRFQTSL